MIIKKLVRSDRSDSIVLLAVVLSRSAMIFTTKLRETNKYAALSQREAGTVDNNWEDTNVDEIEAYIGILIYVGLFDLPEIYRYFLGDFCFCPIVRQAMTLK
jgi:hypothetical protein